MVLVLAVLAAVELVVVMHRPRMVHLGHRCCSGWAVRAAVVARKAAEHHIQKAELAVLEQAAVVVAHGGLGRLAAARQEPQPLRTRAAAAAVRVMAARVLLAVPVAPVMS
jgi:hypothetical protein